MNEASQWRIQLAGEIAAVYRALAPVRMAALGGSAARGLADEYSDLDIAVYWEAIDATLLDPPPLAAAGAERFTFHRLFGGLVAVEQYFVGDAKVDVAHFAIGWLEAAVADVIERCDLDNDKHEVLDGFLSAIVLFGQAEYAAWRARIAAYPDALAHAMVRQHLRFYPRWVLEQQALARDDLLAFYSMLCEQIGHLLGVLAGLNRIYLSMEKTKRSADLLRRMPIAPVDARSRFDALLAADRHAAPATLAALIDETLALVEQHMPAVDTRRTRMIQRMQVRPAHAKPPFQPG